MPCWIPIIKLLKFYCKGANMLIKSNVTYHFFKKLYAGPLGMLDLMYFQGMLLLEKTHNITFDFIAEFSTELIFCLS